MIPFGVLSQQQRGVSGPAPPLDSTDLIFHVDAGDPTSYTDPSTNWTDIEGSVVGTLYDTPAYLSDVMSRLDFDGLADYAHWNYAANIPQIQPGYSGTIELVWKDGGNGPLITNDRHTSATSFGQITVSSNRVSFYTAPYSATPYAYTIYSDAVVNPGGWNYAAISGLIPSSSGTMEARFLVNGVFTDSSIAILVNVGNQSVALEVARMHNYTYSTTFGANQMAVVRAYNTRLSDTQMVNNYNYYSSIYT